MQDDPRFSKTVAALQTFFTEESCAHEALLCLRKGIEVSVELETDEGVRLDCALVPDHASRSLRFETRPATSGKFDFIFRMKTQTADRLTEKRGLNISQVGVAVAQEIAHGRIRVRFTGSALGLIRNGYLEVIQKGGREFSAFLAARGFGSVTTIINAIKRLRSS